MQRGEAAIDASMVLSIFMKAALQIFFRLFKTSVSFSPYCHSELAQEQGSSVV